MKIGLIYQKFVSTGGLEGYLFNLAKALLEDGHDLHVLTGQTDAQSEGLGIEFTKVDLPRSKTRALLAFERAVLELGADLPVDTTIGFGRTTQQDLHRAGAGCHATYLPLLNPLKRIGFKSQVELALEKDLYTSERTKHFVANSDLVCDQLVGQYSVPREKFTIIHTAVDTERFKPDATTRAEFRERHDIAGDTQIVLFVSRAHRRKGLPALLAAWPEIHKRTGARLWLAGPRVERFIKGLPTELHGTVTHHAEVDDIVPLYQAADLFVHPSLYDACANTVLQSMACGLPGIISAADGARQFVDQGQTGWLLDNPISPEEIAKLTIGALESDRRTLSAAAREKMLPLTWGAHVSAWEQAITALASA